MSAVKVQGWDTDGVVEIGGIEDGRIKLAFKGNDGSVRNIFIPHETLGYMIPGLVNTNADIAAKLGKPDTLSGKHMLGISAVRVGSDDAGKEFVFELVTGDKVGMRFLLDRRAAESLATAFIAALLAKHGIHVEFEPPAGSRRQ